MIIFIDDSVPTTTDPNATAVLAAMLHYWNMDEADTNAATTTRVDLKASGTAWDLTESAANLAETGTGLRGGGSVAARTVNGGSAPTMGGLANINRTANLTSTQSFTVAGWVNPTIPGSGFPLTIFREAAFGTNPANINFWIGIDDAGTPGSPYSVFCLTRGSSSGDATRVAKTEQGVSGTWIFVQAQRDHANNKVRIRVNNGAWTETATSVANYTSGADITVGMTLTSSTNRLDRMTARYNFWGYYGAALSDAQLDYLYNSGNGRTYAEIVAQA